MDTEYSSSIEDLLPQVESKSYAFLDKLGLDLEVRKRLTLHLDNMVKGSTDVLVTPLGKDNDANSILEAWDSIFNKYREKMNDPLIELELSNREKFSPRSLAKPWSDRVPGFSEYFGADECTIPARYLFPGRVALPKNKLRPLSLKEAIKCLKNNTNSGLPYYTRKGLVKDRYIEKFDQLLARKDPCVLFTRTQENFKTRDVWGFPMADTLFEMRYYRPLLEFQRRLDWRAALRGPNDVDKALTNLIDRGKSSELSLISIDFSVYDRTVRKTLQESAFDYIRWLYQDEHARDLDYIEERFGNIGIITPSGVVSNKTHGVPSGSTFTNEVDSIVQYLVAYHSSYINDGLFQIQGDDGVYAIPANKVDKFNNVFTDAGQVVNSDKSTVSEDYVIYLQKLHHSDYRDKRTGLIGGVYPTYRALNRLIYQERWSGFEDFGIKGRDYYSIRAYSILENCKNHPLFEEFVGFVKELDKYSLGVTRGSVKKYTDYISQSEGGEGLVINQYGDDTKGLTSFRSWKIVNNK